MIEILNGASARIESIAACTAGVGGAPASAAVPSVAPASLLEKVRRFMDVPSADSGLPSSLTAPLAERKSTPCERRRVQASLRNCGSPDNWILASSAVDCKIALPFGTVRYDVRGATV